MSEPIRPFACGTQFMDWERRNCERCAKAWADDEFHCDLQKALSLGAVGDGTITTEVARRIGFTDPLRFSWDCPERTADFPPDLQCQERPR